MSKQARIISLANQKGGVGKTSTTANVAYELSKEGYKILTVDLDSQTNITDSLLQTKYPDRKEFTVDKTLMDSISSESSLKDAVVNIKPNFDLIPSTFDVFQYEYYLQHTYNDDVEQAWDFKHRIDELKPYYDYIFIDTPPSISLMSIAAFISVDNFIIVMQTQKRALDAVQNFVNFMQDTLVNRFEAHVSVLGILPVLRKTNSDIDDAIINGAKDMYGSEYVFNNIIKNMKRVERMDFTGITDNPKDRWDEIVHHAYKKVADEMVKRLED